MIDFWFNLSRKQQLKWLGVLFASLTLLVFTFINWRSVDIDFHY